MGNEVLPLNVQKAVDIIYKTQGFTLEELRQQDRHIRICNCRQWLAYFLFKELGYTKRDIGVFFCKHRTSAYAMIRQVEALLKARDKMMREIRRSFMDMWKDNG